MDSLPPIGLGTMAVSSPETVTTAIEVGYRHIDTAQVYENERVVGEGIATADRPRSELFVATKLWVDALGADAVPGSAAASRERLGLDVLDLLYVHRPRDTYDPVTTLPALDALVDEGVVRHVGVSNFTLADLAEAREHLDAPIFAHQVEFHPLFQPDELLADAQDRDYWLVAYSPLAGGRVFDLPAVREVAERHDASPAAVSIAWLLAKENVVTIPKASSEAHLRANLDARQLSLTDEDVATIDGVDREEELYPD